MLLLLLPLRNSFRYKVRQLCFDLQAALGSVLSMAIKDTEKVLMVRLAHVRGKDKVILILLVDVVNTESFSCRVCKPCYNITINKLLGQCRLILLQLKRLLTSVINSVMVIKALV